MMPCIENGATSAVGASGATINVIAPAKNKRNRAGTACAPNTGATMKHAPIRKNGQMYMASQDSSWPVVSAITGVFCAPTADSEQRTARGVAAALLSGCRLCAVGCQLSSNQPRNRLEQLRGV